MSASNDHGRPRPDLPDDTVKSLDHASLLRCAADDELSADQRRRAGVGDHPDDSRRIEFERELRQRVASAIEGAHPAPGDDVRRSIRDTLSPSSEPSRRMAIGGLRWAVAAAVALLAAGAALQPLSPVSPWRPSGVARLDDAGARARLASFVVSQHEDCEAFGKYFRGKMSVTDPSKVMATAADLLRAAPISLTLDSVGYELAGVGPCGVPGPGRSVHVIYRAVGASGESGAPLSLFIQRIGREQDRIDESRRIALSSGRENRSPVIIWRSGDLIYYLVASRSSVDGAVLAALRAPSVESRLF